MSTATVERSQSPRILKAPFPWFGGKSRVARPVWDRFGSVENYVEPFAGSLAVLLGRPSTPGTETVNDLDCYLANFWRSISTDACGTAEHCDWPVNEADLHARHLWLVNQEEFRERMKTDPEFFDVKIAGWWVWGISQWIGSGWCSRPDWTGRRNAGRESRGIFRKGRHQFNPEWQCRPFLTTSGQGVHAGKLNRKRPMIHGGHTGKGVHAAEPGVASQFGAKTSVTEKRPHLSGRGTGIGIHGDLNHSALYAYFEVLAARLRRVRVCCGDWTRVLGPSVTVKHGVCGVFLDPPYDMRVVSGAESGAPTDGLYSSHDNDLSKAVAEWAIANGNNPLLRIALCGYEGEHQFPNGWECVPWKAHGGYGSQRGDRGYENAARERIWFSPHCLKTTLFSGLDEGDLG
jgi:hypothetical protein